MSVLIRGMRFPKACDECLINCGRSMLYIGITDRRSPNCPLVEIPTPHGRLIVEKTITEIRYHDADGYHIVNGEQLCELEIDAGTVIEAEGSE